MNGANGTASVGARIVAAVAAVAFASSAATAAAAANPHGQWATVAVVKASLVGKPLQAMTCRGSSCSLPSCGECTVDDAYNDGFALIKVGVISARVAGVGRSLLVNGQRRYQLFQARLCAQDFTRGGEHVTLRAVWHTRRPKAGYYPIGLPDPLLPWVLDKYGVAYAEDWRARGWFPVFGPGFGPGGTC